MVTFFVSETPWDENEKMDLFKKLRDAESWLEWKAKEYGRAVRFDNGVHGLFEPFEVEVVPNYEAGPAADLAERYLTKAGLPAVFPTLAQNVIADPSSRTLIFGSC